MTIDYNIYYLIIAYMYNIYTIIINDMVHINVVPCY